MKYMIFNLCVLAVTSIAPSYAQNNPSAYISDARIKKVLYQENNVIPINGVTFTSTQVQFGNNERILDIEGGDTAAWMVTYHPELANMLFIKPTILNSHTNLTVITNLHAYYFQLHSNQTLKSHANQLTYALKFIYPTPVVKSTKVSKAPLQPKVVNTAYRFSGSPQLVPVHIFDDGQFTYFELSHQGIVPAIFAVDEKNGKESTVNTRRQGKYLVVLRIAPQFTLRHAGLTTSVFNTHEINRIAQNRRPQ